MHLYGIFYNRFSENNFQSFRVIITNIIVINYILNVNKLHLDIVILTYIKSIIDLWNVVNIFDLITYLYME